MLKMFGNMTATTDSHSENQPQMHGTHYGGRSFPDVMQGRDFIISNLFEPYDLNYENGQNKELNTRPIIDEDINELNLEWLFKDEKTSTSLQILQSINQIKLSNYDNRFDEFREWVKKLKRRSYNTAQENPEFDKYLDYVKDYHEYRVRFGRQVNTSHLLQINKKHFSNWGIQLMPVKIKEFSILDMELYEFVWKFCEKQLRREIQYFYVQSIIEIPQEVDDRFLDGQGMCWYWAEKEILDTERTRTSTEVNKYK